MVFGSGAFHFPNTTEGLDQLSSYKATLTMTFDGLRLGRTSQWPKTYTLLYSKQPLIWQLTVEKSGDLPNLEPILMAERDGVAYERRGTNSCTGVELQLGKSLLEKIHPALFLTGVIGAEGPDPSETVNNVQVNRYIFDKNALGEQGITDLSGGSLWVASTGGYLVKYFSVSWAKSDYFGEGIEGKLTLDYELKEINQPITFALPQDCPGGMVNAPLLPNAANIEQSPGLLTFTTSTDLATASTFYQTQIPLLGWTAVGDPQITEFGAVLEYKQGDQQMIIFITSEVGVTTVNIMIGPIVQ